jgi:iron complex outermembrane recepter protein
VYVNYRYIGGQYVDIANNVHLPGYGLLAAGITLDLTPKLNMNVSGQNLTNKIGLTEGNPRQGVFAQQIVNGSFYGRSVAGADALISFTYSFY